MVDTGVIKLPILGGSNNAKYGKMSMSPIYLDLEN